eukprot:scpid10055/ scgid4087/ Iroquois-class homeodomain protein IRX-5; Homeodomain protein IRXB2; Iroquois homeobox protein 5
MLHNSGAGGTLCSAMAATWTPKHADVATVQQPVHATYQQVNIASSHHHHSASTNAAAAASFHHVHRQAAAPTGADFTAIQFAKQPCSNGHQVHHPQQQQQHSSLEHSFANASSSWLPPPASNNHVSPPPPRGPCLNVPIYPLSTSAPVTQAICPQQQQQQPVTTMPIPTQPSAQTGSGERLQGAGSHSNLSSTMHSQSPPTAGPVPIQVMMPVSISAPSQTSQLAYQHQQQAVHHQHHQQTNRFTQQPAPCLSHSSPERPAFFHNVPAVSIHQTPSNSLLFHEPITQKQRTRPLRDWILSNRSHPYPSRDEKLALAMLTHMRVDQVTMWFANTRRQIRRIGMKAWSGGMFDTALPYRIGNGAIIPAASDDGVSGDEESSGSLADSSSHVPTDSSGSLD